MALSAAALTLAACAGDKVWMRSGAGPSDAEIDQMSCAEQSERSGMSLSINETSPQMDRFSSRYACLRSRGYRLVPLTAEESARLKASGGVEKDEYWASLLRKNGLAPAQSPPAGAVAPSTGPRPEQAPPRERAGGGD